MEDPSLAMDRETERECYTRMQGGDSDACEQLARSVLPFAMQAVARACPDLGRIEVESAAGLAVAEALARWDPSKGALTTYVGRTALTAACEEWRTSRAVTVPDRSNLTRLTNRTRDLARLAGAPPTPISDVPDTPDDMDPERKARESAALAKRVHRTLDAMPEFHRSILKEYYLDGRSTEAIGINRNLGSRRIRQLVSMGRNLFRRYWDVTGGDTHE